MPPSWNENPIVNILFLLVLALVGAIIYWLLTDKDLYQDDLYEEEPEEEEDP